MCVSRLLLATLLLALPAARGTEPFTFAALGCMPYGLPASAPAFERLLAEINRHAPAFTVHLGDIKSGGEPISDALLDRIHDYFMTLDGPLIYTPGDNEWTDVHRRSVGGLNPVEWLGKLRTRYFSAEQSLGRTPLPLVTQRRDPAHAFMVENARWSINGVVFATVHVVGSNNNDDPEVPGARDEFLARDAANVAWVRATFAEARATDAPGVALFFQANPFGGDWDRPGYDSGFENFLRTVEAEALAYARPVLLLHVDDHLYRLDHGVRFQLAAAPAANVSRLATFGAGDLHASLVVVQPDHPQVFLPGPLLVPGNPLPRAFNLDPQR